MQWDASPFAGFSTTRSWLPLHKNYLHRNVASQSADPGSLLNFYRSLIALRRRIPPLRRGEFVPITSKPAHILAYLRQTDDQKVLVALNYSNRPQSLEISPAITDLKWELLLSTNRETLELSGNHLRLEPLEVLLASTSDQS